MKHNPKEEDVLAIIQEAIVLHCLDFREKGELHMQHYYPSPIAFMRLCMFPVIQASKTLCIAYIMQTLCESSSPSIKCI